MKLSHQDAVQWSETYMCTPWLHKLDHCIKRFNCTLNDSATKLQHVLEHDYKRVWLNTMQNGGKLRAYAIFKHNFSLENYLLHEILLIAKFTRLRTSSHKLAVETGRFNKTPVENRVCAFCYVGSVEDEFHLMMSCSVYENFRSTLKEYLSSFSDILSISDEQLFPILMSCNNGDYEFTKVVCKFVNASFEKRSHHLMCVDQSV